MSPGSRFKRFTSLRSRGSRLGAYRRLLAIELGNIAASEDDRDRDGGCARDADFRSSRAVLNDVYNTSVWTLANLVARGMSVDCPHRERRGYFGDVPMSIANGYRTCWMCKESRPTQYAPRTTAASFHTRRQLLTVAAVQGGRVSWASCRGRHAVGDVDLYPLRRY